MAAIKGIFFNLPTATLNTLLTNYLNCLTAIAVAGQKYNIGGRDFTRPDIEFVKDTIRELESAIRYAAGNRITRTRLTVFPNTY